MSDMKKKLSREDAAELYRDLHKTIGKMKASGTSKNPSSSNTQVAKQIAQAIRESMKKEDAIRSNAQSVSEESESREQAIRAPFGGNSSRFANDLVQPTGVQFAVFLIAFFALSKISFSALEYSGIFSVGTASASLHQEAAFQPMPVKPRYGEEELAVLKQLDARRVELQEKGASIDQQMRELELKEQEFVVRLTELRELTEQLKVSREKSEERRNGQLEQLSNVYGSMAPNESAQLIEQLDVSIALSLLERMPEKRIGQILSLMSAERALTITRMLSRGE
jgi:flagellar motility protein MotE (MotC chaperone)